MSAADQKTALRVVTTYRDKANGPATAYSLPVELVLAVICQESAGDTYAWRPEPGFLKGYGPGILKSVQNVDVLSVRARYLRWIQNGGIVLASSFGLMQVLTIVAIERGMDLPYPSSLCNPDIGIEAGCRQLKFCLDYAAKVDGPPADQLRRGLLRWNGGGNAMYPDEVLAWQAAIRSVSS